MTTTAFTRDNLAAEIIEDLEAISDDLAKTAGARDEDHDDDRE